MLDLIIDIVTLVVIVFAVLWYGVKWLRSFWPSAEATTAGQFVGKLADTTQAYTMYGLLETMKMDNKVKADANALGAIAYLQSVVLQGVSNDWTTNKPLEIPSTVEENPADAHASSIDWSPPDES